MAIPSIAPGRGQRFSTAELEDDPGARPCPRSAAAARTDSIPGTGSDPEAARRQQEMTQHTIGAECKIRQRWWDMGSKPMRLTQASDLAELMAENLSLIEQSLSALGDAASSLTVLPGPAAVRAVIETEHAWRQMVAEFGLLDAVEIGHRAGSRAASERSWASQKRRASKLLGVPRRNRIVYPGFQLDEHGQIRPAVPPVIAVFDQADWREDHVALWFVTANGWLGGQRPVDVPDNEADRVVSAARAAVDRW